MDEGKILLLNLGHLDVETNRLLGSLVMTSFELAMRRRENTQLWPLTIDEFAQYMANEGSVTTLAHLLSEARKFGLGLCISHQTLSQLTPRMLGALGNTDTRLIFGVDRYDAEYLAKIVGRVDTEAIKREPRTDSQYELFSSTQEQWEQWYDQLRFQPPRHAMAMTGDSPAIRIRTLNVPHYEATDEQLEQVRAESAARYGLPYHQARQNVEYGKTAVTETALVPEYELLK
jgi:type IV secretory pathway TraG/TraD family ATPase VirD4